MPSITISDVKPIMDPDPGRAGQPAHLVIYRVEGIAAPRSIVIPGAQLTPSAIETAIRKQESGAAAHVGYTFNV